MRMLERTLRWVELAPRETIQDGLGGGVEGFSTHTTRVRASVIPSDDGVRGAEAGLWRDGAMRLLLPLDVKIVPGDGVSFEDGAPEWRCTEVQRWSAHQAVRIVRIAG